MKEKLCLYLDASLEVAVHERKEKVCTLMPPKKILFMKEKTCLYLDASLGVAVHERKDIVCTLMPANK